MPRLVIYPGTPQAREIELKSGANFFGRGFANDVKIEDPSVSTSHCQIVVENGMVLIKDLGSTNGTFINKAPVREGAISPGSTLHLGGVELFFPQENGASHTPPSATVTNVSSSPGLQLRTSNLKVVNAAPPEAPPMMAVEDAPVAPIMPGQITGSTHCRYHPKSSGRWLCPKCKYQFCDLCVAARSSTNKTGYFCRSCGVECSQVQVVIDTVGLARKQNFYAQIPGAFAYPFKGSGAIILICGGVFMGLVGFLAAFSLYLQIVFVGYLFAYMQNVIHSTSSGDEESASLPEVSNMWEDIIAPCFQLVLTVAACFLPAIALAIYAYYSGQPALTLLIIPALILGGLYFPMAFLAVAMYDTVFSVNPLLIIPSIFRVPVEYLVTLAVIGSLFAFRFGADFLFNLILPIPFVPGIIVNFIAIYALTVEMRILGLLYYTRKDKLGWGFK